MFDIAYALRDQVFNGIVSFALKLMLKSPQTKKKKKSFDSANKDNFKLHI